MLKGPLGGNKHSWDVLCKKSKKSMERVKQNNRVVEEQLSKQHIGLDSFCFLSKRLLDLRVATENCEKKRFLFYAALGSGCFIKAITLL